MQQNNYSLSIRVTQDEMLEVAQNFMDDAPLEIAEVVLNEMAESDEALPADLEKTFALMARVALGVGLAARIKFPDDEREREDWRLITILDVFLSAMGGNPIEAIESGEVQELPLDDIGDQTLDEVIEDRFKLWAQYFKDFSATPTVVLGIGHGDDPGGFFLWSAETMWSNDVLAYLTKAVSFAMQFMVYGPEPGEEGYEPPE